MRGLRHVCLGLGMLLSATARPLSGQSVGTPEHYVKEGQEAFAAKSYGMAAVSFRQAAMLRPENAEYHFLLGAALASDRRWAEAREAFGTATRLNAALQARADAWLAAAPAAKPAPGLPRPPAPEPALPVPPAPEAAPPAPPGPGRGPGAERTGGAAFAVGDRVEVQYRAGEWIPGVVTAADPGPCPYYRVRADAYGRGDSSTLGYTCGSVRAPTGVPQPVAACGGSNPNCPPSSPPPLGTYVCTELVWQGPGRVPQFVSRPRGSITLLPRNRYRMYDNGAVGQYRYDAANTRIRWTGGDMAGRGAAATYGLDGTAPEITIAFDADDTRRTGNAGPRWQCGLDR